MFTLVFAGTQNKVVCTHELCRCGLAPGFITK